ncbi:HD domain-containing protein [Macrococcus bohemicus]|nr:HD domain-containing protein [Macrococcus bohemicus]
MNKELTKILDFTIELEKLKNVTRLNKTLDNRQENSAEHFWHAAFVAESFSKFYPVEIDINKVLKMLLIHDVGEINVGDTFLYDELGKSSSFSRERSSIENTLLYFDENLKTQYLKLWEEFETGNTEEAKFARIVDAILPLINHLVTGDVAVTESRLTKSQVISKKQFIIEDSEPLWDLASYVIDKSVEKGLYEDKL